MEDLLLDLEKEITRGCENTKRTKELYQLLSSYNAYCILLLKIKQEYERKQTNIKQYYSDSNCYKFNIADLFSLFKSDECLICESISRRNDKDMLFLIDKDTLLRIYSFDIMNFTIDGLSHIDYNLLKINNCIAKIYNQRVYSSNPYYYDYHWEDKDAFGFFNNKSLITPAYILDNQFKSYDNMDIREILKVQSLDEIYEKINEAKNIKTKKLILTK